MTDSALMMFHKPLFSRSGREKLIGLVILSLAPFFFIHSPLWLLNDAGQAINNFAHIVFFFLFTVLVGGRLRLTGARAVLAAFFSVLVLSLIIEMVQARIGRTASWHDVMRNLLGCWLALVWLHKATPTIWLGRIAAALLLMVEVALLVQPVIEQLSLSKRLPLLTSVENSREVDHWHATASQLAQSTEQASDGKYSLKVELGQAAPYPGVALKQFAHDWSDFESLLIDIHNPQDQELTLSLRIHDTQHRFGPAAFDYADRFNRRLRLQPGWNAITIPLQDISSAARNRSMDLKRIQEIRFFSSDDQAGKVFYVDNLRLR